MTDEAATSIAEVERVAALVRQTQPVWSAHLTSVCRAARASFRLIGYERINKHGQQPPTYPNEKPVEHPDYFVRELWTPVGP